jgi:hypothetical protein
MKHHVTVHQLSTGRGAYLNVRDLKPVGAGGFDVWAAVGSAEADPMESVYAIVLHAPVAMASAPGFRRFHLMCFDTLAQFTRWREREGMRYESLYLITPAGLERLAPLPAETIPSPDPSPDSGSSDE